MDKTKTSTLRISRFGRLAAMATLTSALALGGCASAPAEAPPAKTSDSASPAASTPKGTAAIKDAAENASKSQDYVAAAAYWGQLYDRESDNVEAAVNYSKSLRQIGSNAQSLSVMQRMQTLHGQDAAVNAEYGKALAASGKPDQAVIYLSRAATHNPKDWTILSAQGVALDQMGRYADAQAQYNAALAVSPGNSSVLTNLGLSYALQGNLDQAEQVLRKAAADPHAPANARQNLAIVLALKGNFDEASRLARSDLPASVADNNIAYLKDMMNQPALWKQMEQLDGGQATPAPH